MTLPKRLFSPPSGRVRQDQPTRSSLSLPEWKQKKNGEDTRLSVRVSGAVARCIPCASECIMDVGRAWARCQCFLSLSLFFFVSFGSRWRNSPTLTRITARLFSARLFRSLFFFFFRLARRIFDSSVPLPLFAFRYTPAGSRASCFFDSFPKRKRLSTLLVLTGRKKNYFRIRALFTFRMAHLPMCRVHRTAPVFHSPELARYFSTHKSLPLSSYRTCTHTCYGEP